MVSEEDAISFHRMIKGVIMQHITLELQSRTLRAMS